MSKVLSKLLDQPQTAITKIIDQLESNNGYPSHDVRLTAENIRKIRSKISELGLDPNDTTSEELYQALLVKFESDARRFDEHFSLFGHSYDTKIKKAVELVSNNINLPDRWALKSMDAKRILRQHPPKHVMKLLNYRSVDSLVKREAVADIYLAIELVESPGWNKAHFKLATQLGTTAFERRRLEIRAMSSRWGVWQSPDMFLASSDYGVVGLAPTKQISTMSLLALVVLLLDEIGARPSKAVALSPVAAWWAETDSLISALDDQPVGLNLKDIAIGHAQRDGKPQLLGSRRHFWRELINRYENQSLDDEQRLPLLELPAVNLNLPINQPAFEYVEDI